jgi:hypothetical protein
MKIASGHKAKKKAQPLSRVLTEQDFSKGSVKKKVMSTSRSDLLHPKDNERLFLTMQDSKQIHNVNLQIPSLNSPEHSISSGKNVSKKSACIKGFSSKLSMKSPKSIKTRKVVKDSGRFKELLTEISNNESKNYSESKEKEVVFLEAELKKALDENKKLKKAMHEENLKEEIVQEMMKSFKSRLYKFLYE